MPNDSKELEPMERRVNNNTANRIFGGSPLGVLFRLVLVSILVGVVLRTLGLNPFDIWNSFRDLFRWFWEMGFDSVRWIWGYFLLGAVIVIPIWIILRLINAPRGR